jgi:transposase
MTLKNKYLYRSHISEKKFRQILRLFCEDFDATKISFLTGISRKTINIILGKIRKGIFEISKREDKFSGEIEVDESYFGARRVRGKRGRGARGKTPVVGLLKRGGKVFTKIIPDCTRKELMPIIKGQIIKQSTVYTDGWKSYDGLVLNGYHHYRIFHHENEFARGKNHVNGIESFWSFTKRRLAKFNGIKKENFLLHLKESEFRRNYDKQNSYRILTKNFRENPL